MFGTFLGQLWAAFDDAAQDVTGKIRFHGAEDDHRVVRPEYVSARHDVREHAHRVATISPR